MIQMDTNMAQHGKDLENTMEWSQNEKLRLEPEQTIHQQLLGRQKLQKEGSVYSPEPHTAPVSTRLLQTPTESPPGLAL